MDDHNITLDADSFKALAVDTRVRMLKILGSRRHTQSELAAELSMSIPAVKEHLDSMEKAGLVQRHDEGRKWIYYSLTAKGKAILNPEEKKFWIVLATLVLTIGGAATGYFKTKYAALYTGATAEQAAINALPAPLQAGAEATVREAAATVTPNAVQEAAQQAATVPEAVITAVPKAVQEAAQQTATVPEAAATVTPGAVQEAAQQAARPAEIPWGWIILGAIIALQLALLAYYYARMKSHQRHFAELDRKGK